MDNSIANLNIGKTRKDFKSDYEWMVNCAEYGASDYQLQLAFLILSTRTDEKRVAEAYKWLFIATYLGNERGNSIVSLLQSCMSDEQLLEAKMLIELWIKSKQDEFIEGRINAWTQQLKDTWAKNESH